MDEYTIAVVKPEAIRPLIYVIAATVGITFLLMLGAMKLIVALAPWETTTDATVAFNEIRSRLNEDEKLLTANEEQVSEHQKELSDIINRVTVNLDTLTTSVQQVTQNVAVLQQQMTDSWPPPGVEPPPRRSHK